MNATDDDVRSSYVAALRRYNPARLADLRERLGGDWSVTTASAQQAELLAKVLAEPRLAADILAGQPRDARLVLGIMAFTEQARWPAVGLQIALRAAGVAQPADALERLVERGLLAIQLGPDRSPVADFARALRAGSDAELLAHPAALASARTLKPEGDPPPTSAGLRGVRQGDGLEPILRLAALWQRVQEAPIRRTQQGSLFKRDRERLDGDPVISDAASDAIEPIPDPVSLWLDLAKSLGLLVDEPGSDRTVAADAGFWAEHAVHLPQMIAARWLALRTWDDALGPRSEGKQAPITPFLRPAALLWLTRLEGDQWVTLDDLAGHLDRLGAKEQASSDGRDPLRGILLGSAYQLGLVRVAERTDGHRAVQLTPLGRYALALGPPPEPATGFDHFLYVQPNYEVIAYRQGLTPSSVGQLARFAQIQKVGAALELKVAAESVYRGLEGGLSPESILERLARHSARPLPAGVSEAVRTWAGRRSRVTYNPSATLVEFADAEALESALKAWSADEGRESPIRVAERLLLVEDERSIPFGRFRLAGSRDYRRPPEPCVGVDPDGITLSLDLGRSDLFVDAELARFAQEIPGLSGEAIRRFRVTPESVRRGLETGLTPPALARWFAERTGAEPPSATRLLLQAAGASPPALSVERPIVLRVSTAEILDGLLQHPVTRRYLGERLGPSTVVVSEAALPGFRDAAGGLGLEFAELDNAASSASVEPSPRRRRAT